MSEHFSVAYEIDQEEIAARAYQLYEARGCEDSHDLEDWFDATEQLLEERQNAISVEQLIESSQELLSA